MTHSLTILRVLRAASLLIVIAINASTSRAVEILNDSFSNLNNWKDLSTAITWGGNSTPVSAFTTAGGAATLTTTARAFSGYTATNQLKTFTALDHQFASPIAAEQNVVTIDFRVRWDGLNTSGGEAGRFMVVLTHDYPVGGLDLDLNDQFDNFAQESWARPAYHVRLRNSLSSPSFLQYGGGLSALGEFEAYDSSDPGSAPDYWLPGFISGAGGVSPGTGGDYPANSWVSTASGEASTAFQRFRYVISPDKQELFRDANDDGLGYTLEATMLLPPTSSAPYYHDFDTFEGVRLYWRGADGSSGPQQALLDSLSIDVQTIPEPSTLLVAGVFGMVLLVKRHRRRTLAAKKAFQ